MGGGQTDDQAFVGTPLAGATPSASSSCPPPSAASVVEAPHRGRICLDQVSLSRWFLKSGSACAPIELTVYIFRRKRPGGAQVFWNLHSICERLGLASHNEVPSKWVGRSLPRWES